MTTPQPADAAPPTMIDVDQAQRIIAGRVTPLPAVEMPLADALHRTLAAAVCSDLDDPPFDRSSMDGYAVRSGDVANAPVELRVTGQIAAGTEASSTLTAGEAMQINTGAPIPSGADAVVRVEDTERTDSAGDVRINALVEAGRFITKRGTYIRRGAEALSVGTCLTAIEIGVAATCGAGRVVVHRRPRVGVLVTGDELIEIDRAPTGAQIRDSNQWILASLVRSAHAEPVLLGRARDDREALRAAIERGRGCDVLCITGGVSMGEFDFVPEVLASLGATLLIRKMSIKPGRPVHVAQWADGGMVFALPGNPISALVGFELLVRPALALLEGRTCFARPMWARLSGPIGANRARRAYVPARAWVDDGGRLRVERLSWHGSGDPFGMVSANALIVRDPHAGAANSEDEVPILRLGS